MINSHTRALEKLRKKIDGELYTDEISKILYATDASAYCEKPLAVIKPRNKTDILKIIDFANIHKLPLIPRTAGTSLAGQVVGEGIVVDVSKYMTAILELNVTEKWVKVEPGVVLDELNMMLEEHGLFFGPETSTSNRCMIGGMVGNNSCGSHSLLYGSTREHTLEIEAILSNGEEVIFKALSNAEFETKCSQKTVEGQLYRSFKEILSDPENQVEIDKEYPHPDIKRRNTGYALDYLLQSSPFGRSDEPFNMCKLIAGSEGTLAFITAVKLNLIPSPPKEKGVVCAHFNTLEEAFKANLVALEFNPGAIEMMDKTVLDLTKDNITQRKNRFFVEGDPKSLLLIEFARETREEIARIAIELEKYMRENSFGYAFPVVYGSDINKIWELRKAGLGILSNMPGDNKPVSVIEDTVVRPEDLPAYMDDFKKHILEKYNKACVYYAHIGSGELHLRPILNLKDPKDVKLFRDIARDSARLVKKYRGSLSGEHGDGRLRGEFIPIMVGEKNYRLFKAVKSIFDPDNLFNPKKIVDTPKMNTGLRFRQDVKEREEKTYFDWSSTKGVLRAAEKCNGSGDCRKSEIIGGTMCPSYQGMRDEKATTRARANILREFLTRSEKENPFDHHEIYEILDLCLSCKACKSECPSSVDMAKLKAEFLQHYYNANGIPRRAKIVAYSPRINRLLIPFSGIYNLFISHKGIANSIKWLSGFAIERSLPRLNKTSVKQWHKKHRKKNTPQQRKVSLFMDEFTDYNNGETGIKAILLLEKLGYEVTIPRHVESGRTFLSKGLVKAAKKVACKNVALLADTVTSEHPLIGIEPSGILTFRDEYRELVDESMKERANLLAENCLLIDEFLDREMAKGHISQQKFTKKKAHIRFHGHCYQKALASTACTQHILSFPENYTAEEIPSGCCGMAGAFGYEKEHYELSVKVGELILLPEVRKTPSSVLIAAPGTSCRHQINDGTGRKAAHPVEILFDALA